MTELDRFEAEGVTLICGDSTTMRIEADAVISDPPYGMKWDTDSTRFTGGESASRRGDGRSNYGSVGGDSSPFDPSPWLQFGQCVLFGSNHFSERLPVGTTLVWLKKYQHQWGTFLSDAEVAWMKGGHGVYVFLKAWNPPARTIDYGGDVTRPVGIHPTQKPVALMAWCMERAKVAAGSLVADPYMGSGTTVIACIRTGRKFIGIEKDPNHFKTAVERIKRELSQGVLAL